MIRILIAEDSHVMAQILKTLFDGEPDLEVVGVAINGVEAVRMAAELKPDVITMDVIMPKMDGVEATKRIMSETPTPIVVISSHVNDKEMQITFRSLAAGALNVLGKPEDVNAPKFDILKRTYISTIRDMSTIKVARRVPRKFAQDTSAAPRPMTAPQPRTMPPAVTGKPGDYKLVALGSSTGGPQAVRAILGDLPKEFPAPIIIAQHITRGFGKGMVDWLNRSVALTIKVAEQGERCLPGTVYFAPDGKDVGVNGDGLNFRIKISEERPPEQLTPSVDYLFDSISKSQCGKVICGLLTGMGRDGAKGMLNVRQREGYTFAQAEESCVVFGMPAEALNIGATDRSVMLNDIAGNLNGLVRR